jgi:hypothetical protein
MLTKSDIQSVKDRFDLRDIVAKDLGDAPKKSRNYSIWKSPFRDERTASFVVHDTHYNDYGEPGRSGDVIQYIRETRGLDFVEAVEYLTGEDFREWKPKPPKREEKPKERKKLELHEIAKYERNVDTIRPYLESRAIPAEIVQQFHLGCSNWENEYVTTDGKRIKFKSNRLVIPHIYDEQVMCLNFRRNDEAAEKWINKNLKLSKVEAIELIRHDMADKLQVEPKSIEDMEVWENMYGPRYQKPYGMKDFIFGIDWLYAKKDGKRLFKKLPYIIVDEGELNALSAVCEGFRAISFKAFNQFDLAQILKYVGVIYVAQHNDDDQTRKDGTIFNPGRHYTKTVLEQFKSNRSRVRAMNFPPEFKDMNEMRVAGELKRFLANQYHLEIMR